MQVEAQIDQVTDPVLTENKTADSSATRVTAVKGLYLLVVAAAVVMRFSQLGSMPLSPAEASEALAVWQFLQPGSLTIAVGSPAYFTLTSLLVPVLGVSDTVMRLVPATFGLGLIFLPWLLRRQLGIVGALIGASLLAVSPLNSAVSRTAGGDAIALFALLLVTASLARLGKQDNEKWFYVTTTALGLGLASSPLFYSGLLTLGIVLLTTKFTTKVGDRFALPGRATIINGLILGVLVLIGLSTRFLTYPAGLGASAQLIGEWLAQFGFSGSLQSTLAPILVLARYEIALIVLGTAAVVWTIWRSSSLSTLLLLWLLAAVGLIILQSGAPSNVLLPALPGYLLIGLFSTRLLRGRINGWTWIFTGGLLLIGAVLLVNITRYLRVSIYEQDLSNLWLGILALAAAVLIIYYFWAMSDASIGQGIWLAALLLLLAFEWGTAWHLTHTAANDPRERWISEGTDDDVPLLLDTLQDISRQAANSDNDLTVLSAVDTPVLRWYLRDFWQATLGETVPPNAQQQVIISRLGDADPQFGSDYVGSDFGLLQSETITAQMSERPVADTLRWWLFHETSAETIEDRVILWVRTDVVLPQQ